MNSLLIYLAGIADQVRFMLHALTITAAVAALVMTISYVIGAELSSDAENKKLSVAIVYALALALGCLLLVAFTPNANTINQMIQP